jgi:HTH-type transcriptional regulator / antitoxin HigA
MDHISQNKDFFKELYAYLNKNPQSLKTLFEQKVAQLGLSNRQIENGLDIERKSLLAILDMDAQRVDVINLIKIGSFLDLNVEETLKIFAANLPTSQIHEIEKVRNFNFIIKNFDITTLKSVKILESVRDFEEIENRLKTFFGIGSIYDYERTIGAAFSKTKRPATNKMLDFWVKSTYAFFEKVNNPNPYQREALKMLVPKIKPCTMEVKKGLQTVVRALFNVGVTVVFQPYLPKTQVRGATFFVEGKPCIALTNLNQNYATIWFALMHELYHVLFDETEIQLNTYHLTGENDLFLLNEHKANDFAKQYFISDEKSKYIYPFIQEKVVIEQYAKKIQIHPSLIYNFYCYDKQKEGKNYWAMFQKYQPDLSEATKNISIALWDKATIAESVSIIQSLIKNYE